MTPLGAALHERIRADGPITVEAYMAACNVHYYATRDPLGAAGDFTTAPEISQMYGEMIGAALAEAWHRAGRPGGVRYAELGPGRGTLAVDALRVMASAGCVPAEIDLVETSPALRRQQGFSAGLRSIQMGVEHGSKRRHPRLPLMLRPEVRHNGVGNVALHQLRAPVLPVPKKLIERLQLTGCTQSPQHFGRGWR